MSQQVINTGTVPNDGTGDTARAGGIKINANFAEVYAALGGSGSPPALPSALPVANGGTGLNTVTAGRITVGNGTSAFNTYSQLAFDGTTFALTVNGIRLLSAGTHNQFIGSSSGNTTLSGSFNLGVGETSLSAITSGQFNVGLGYEAGKSLQGGSNNMAIGTDALFSCVSGGSNVAIGTSALFNATSSNNVALGTNALTNLVAGASNVAIGFSAALNSTGGQAVCIGTSAGANNDSNSGDNVNIGYRAGQGTAGNFIYQNVFIGIDSGRTITSAHDTTAIGAFAAATLTSGASNTLIGSGADVSTGAATNRVVIGKSASGDTDNQVFLGNSSITAWVAGADNQITLGRANRRFNGLFVSNTDTAAGTTGAQTINKVCGSVRAAAASTSLVVTNSLVTANSKVFVTVATSDTTCTLKNVVTASGSFTINYVAPAAETQLNFFVVNTE